MKKIIGFVIVVLIISNISTFSVISSEESQVLIKITESKVNNQMTNINVLAVIPNNFGANTFFNLDNIELFGWNVTLTGLTDIVQPCPGANSSFRIPEFHVDILIENIVDISYYDVLAIMPAFWRSGDAYGDLINSMNTLNLISSAKDNGLVIWATCAGVRVLAAADILNGVNVTGRKQFISEYEAAGAIYLGENIPPIIDQNIITCMRGQYWNKENIEAIATALEQKIYTSTNMVKISEKVIQTNTNPDGGLWTKTYGGYSSDGGKKIYSSIDNKYIIVGYTYSSGVGNSDMYVICIDEHGDILWSNTYGGSGWEYGYGICKGIDSGYILTGYSTSFNIFNSKDVFVIKIDENGNELWSKSYGGMDLDVGRSVCYSNDGYLICGYTESFGSGENDIYVIKIDETGNVMWEKQYGGEGAELGYQIKKTIDNNFVIIGASGSDRANYDFYLLKIDDDGNIIWENYYDTYGGDGGYDRGHSVVETIDGGYLIAGETNYGDALNILVVKTDSEGNEEWSQIFGESLHDHGCDVIKTSDGNYVVCGRFDKTLNGTNDIGLIKIDVDGKEIWKKIIAMSNSDWATSIIETNNNELLITGHTDSIGYGSYDMLVIKTDINGNSNQQPEKPSKPIGITSGKIEEEYVYSTSAIDPENEDVFYFFDWGDDTNSGWLGPYESGETCDAPNIWNNEGNYQIRVKARDINGGESEWSDPLEISMPHTYDSLQILINRLMFRFTILEPILSKYL